MTFFSMSIFFGVGIFFDIVSMRILSFSCFRSSGSDSSDVAIPCRVMLLPVLKNQAFGQLAGETRQQFSASSLKGVGAILINKRLILLHIGQ